MLYYRTASLSSSFPVFWFRCYIDCCIGALILNCFYTLLLVVYRKNYKSGCTRQDDYFKMRSTKAKILSSAAVCYMFCSSVYLSYFCWSDTHLACLIGFSFELIINFIAQQVYRCCYCSQLLMKWGVFLRIYGALLQFLNYPDSFLYPYFHLLWACFNACTFSFLYFVLDMNKLMVPR